MKKFDTDPEIADTEREIASRFARMRASEAATAPAFSRQTSPVPERHKPERLWTMTGLLPRLAAAVAVVAVAIALLSETGQEDPAALYAGIMKNQQVQTDALLIVSDSVLPALSAVPRLYDMESAFAIEAETK